MKGQQSLNDIEYGMLKHKIKREVFLDKMESVNLSAEGTEANIHDIYAFRKFKGINFAEE